MKHTFLLTLLFLSAQFTTMAFAPQHAAVPADSVKKLKKVSFYDTSAIYTKHWNRIVTLAYGREKFDHSDLLRITDSLHGYAFPIEKETTSGFGRRHGGYHKGIDIPLKVGEPIVAAFDGKVRYAAYNSGGFGNLIIIRHPNGLETYYAHLSKVKVKENQIVKAGQVIGLGGSTGQSYTPHLHFEVRYHDVAIDPEKIFDIENYCLRKEMALVEDLMRPENAPKKTIPERHDTGDLYAIRSGDTLSKIAARYGTTVDALCRLNGISKTSVLRVGQEIKVQ
jgi:murein DD-endopeptidase MepM/ murein hydrolase activator NlpD